MEKLPFNLKVTYMPGAGSFIVSSNTFFTCRDQFHNYFGNKVEKGKSYDFYFVCGGKNKSMNVINFMNMVELIANVNEENKLKISQTTEDRVVHVKVSEWWANPVRRSVMTIFLRAGIEFSSNDGETFVKSLYKNPYTKPTKDAIERFLSGYTSVKNKSVYYNNFSGWYNLFTNKQNDPSKILVKPAKSKKEVKENE